MTSIIISRADEVLKIISEQDIVAVLSIEHPDVEKGARGSAPRLDEEGFGHIPQLVLAFWDVEQPVRENGPDLPQIERGVQFMLEHLEKGTVLVHCLAGKARSVAIALGVLAIKNPAMDEAALLEKLLDIRPIAAPNIIIVEMVDTLAGREGRLVKAVLDHPQITEQRIKTEEHRQEMMKNRPEIAHKLFPEKFPKP